MDCGIRDTEPAAAWQDAFLTGNGRHGAMAFGNPRDETVIINHHRLTVPNASERPIPPPLADRLAEIRELLLAGKSPEAVERFCADWPDYAPRPFHPAFAMLLRQRGAPGGPVTRYRRTADFRTGVLTTAWQDAAGPWRRTCFVSRARDVVVQRLELPPPGTGAELEICHDVGLPGAPPGLEVSWQARLNGRHGVVIGLRVQYPVPPGGPDAHAGYCGATRIEAPGAECIIDGSTIRVHAASSVLCLTQVASFQADSGAPDATGCAGDHGTADDHDDDGCAALGGLIWELSCLPADHMPLLAEHARLHRRAFGRTRLDLGASPADRRLGVAELLRRQAARPHIPQPALLEKLFDSGRYLLLSASGELPSRLSGLWQGDWHAAWSGAITTNANLGLQLAGAVTTRVPAAVRALADMVAAQLADWRVNASRIYGVRGILAPAHTDGSSGLNVHFDAAYPHHMWTAGADWLLVPLLDYADATGDERFLAEQVLPALTELAVFYEDFLATTGDAGHVVFVPSYSPENRPEGWTEAAVNATMDVAAARHALAAAAAVCVRLGVQTGPGEGVTRWRALLGMLPPYRINDDGALAEWAWPPDGPPVADRYDHRHVSHLYPVWPLHEITVADTPALAAAALRALRLRGSENSSAHGYLHRALAAARLRDAGLAGQLLASLTGGGFFFRSLMSSHYPDRHVFNADAACCLPGLLAELLVDSVAPRSGLPGRVDLLPAVPRFLPSGRLRGVSTLTGARIDLAWDLAAGTVQATLRSPVSQRIELICRDRRQHVDLAAGVALNVTMEVSRGEALHIDHTWPAASGRAGSGAYRH